MKSLAPNTLLQNRYLVVHLIGKGGMGDVYLAVDQRLGSAVALKRTFFSDDEMLGNAFEREAKTLARLRHPVLTKVSDHFSENDVQFLVMEHISGDDLAKRLEAAQKPFPLSWVLFWADQLLDALAYLHSHEPQIIHRDIKPQNLKLTDENSIILLDFGLSKNTAADVRGGVVTGSSGSTASVVGYTPNYAPMEQIRGTGTNPKSDIYALSATLYQLLTNVVPFDALTRADSLLNGLEDPTTPINEINPEVPPGVAAVILKGMELSQDKRFADAREMQKALRETFNQIQSSMAAQTIAFNLQDELAGQPVGLPDFPLPDKPSVLNVAPKTNQTPPSAGVYNSAASQPQNLNSLKTSIPAQEPNFDATLRMDAPPIDSYSKPAGNSPQPGDSYPPNQSGDSYSKQSDVRTEVFLAGSASAPLIPPADDDFASFNKNSVRENTFNESVNNKADAFSSADDYGGDAFAGIENKYAPNAVPLFSADNKTEYISSAPADSDFFDSPKVQQEGDAFSNYAPENNYAENDYSEAKASREDIRRDEKFTPVPPVAAKKPSSKTAAIIGGLFALVILVLGAAGAGWFIYNNYAVAEPVKTPTPTPEPTVVFTPTPEPTVEAVIETNTNAANNSNAAVNSNNSNSEDVAGNSNTETNSQTGSPTNRTTGSARTPQPVVTPKPQVTVRTTPRVNPTPAGRPSVKPPTPRRPDAPVILP